MKTYVGIDPGKTGCVAVLTPTPGIQPPERRSLFDTVNAIAYMSGSVTLFDAEVGIDFYSLGNIIGKDAFVLLEKPQIMHPKRFRNIEGEMVEEKAPQGVVGMLNYGIEYGKYLGMLMALQIPYAEIHPMTWKKEFNLIIPNVPLAIKKQRSIEVAKSIFPMEVDKLKRKKDHGRAEALLIAEYARRRNM